MADHDQRFKTLLREFLPEFIRLALPEWADRFDFAATEWLEQEIAPDPPEGKRHYVDLVARVGTRQELAPQQAADQPRRLLLIHVEVESADSVEPLRGRVFDYHRHLRFKHRLPVLSVALYLRVGLDGLGWDVYEEWLWERRVARFEYPYLGLPALDAFQYLQGENWLGVALSVLMRSPPERRSELKAEAMQRLATSPENEWRRFLLCECVEAYLPLEGPQLAEYEHLLRSERYQEARAMATTSFEKGLERGQRLLLRRQLERRFGPLSAAAQERLEALPAERLADLGEALLTAPSLQELGLEG